LEHSQAFLITAARIGDDRDRVSRPHVYGVEGFDATTGVPARAASNINKM